MARRIAVGIAAGIFGALVLGTVALADDGGVMQQMMGHDAFSAMVQQMRSVLGNERADQMLASCEAMHAAQAGAGAQGGMSGMMSGSGMQGMMRDMMGR